MATLFNTVIGATLRDGSHYRACRRGFAALTMTSAALALVIEMI
jgi:hypothetical protein